MLGVWIVWPVPADNLGAVNAELLQSKQCKTPQITNWYLTTDHMHEAVTLYDNNTRLMNTTAYVLYSINRISRGGDSWGNKT